MIIVFPFPRFGLPFAVVGILRFPVSILRLAVPGIIRLTLPIFRFLVRRRTRFGNWFRPGIRIRAISGLRRWRRGRRCGNSARNSKVQCSLSAQNDLPLARCDSGQSSGTGSGCRADQGTLAAVRDAADDRSGSCATEDQAGVAASVGLAVNLLGFGDDRRVADLRELKSDRSRPLEPARTHRLDDSALNLRAFGPDCLAGRRPVARVWPRIPDRRGPFRYPGELAAVPG